MKATKEIANGGIFWAEHMSVVEGSSPVMTVEPVKTLDPDSVPDFSGMGAAFRRGRSAIVLPLARRSPLARNSWLGRSEQTKSTEELRAWQHGCADWCLVPKSRLHKSPEEAYRSLAQGTRIQAARRFLSLLAKPPPVAIRNGLPPCADEIIEWLPKPSQPFFGYREGDSPIEEWIISEKECLKILDEHWTNGRLESEDRELLAGRKENLNRITMHWEKLKPEVRKAVLTYASRSFGDPVFLHDFINACANPIKLQPATLKDGSYVAEALPVPNSPPECRLMLLAAPGTIFELHHVRAPLLAIYHGACPVWMVHKCCFELIRSDESCLFIGSASACEEAKAHWLGHSPTTPFNLVVELSG
jgi:hypothetical protein